MRALDLFAGCGGLSLGLQRAGFDVHGVEFDASARASHERNVGPCALADVTTYHPTTDALVVAGGPPCQTFSHAGGRAGTSDPRGQLYQQLLRVGREAHARIVLMENVRTLRTHAKGAVFEQVLEGFVSSGFSPLATVLNAKHFGEAQDRQRLVIVGFSDPKDAARFRWPTPTHGPGLLPYRTVREALGLVGDYGRTRRVARASTEAGGKARGWWQGGRALDVDRPGYTVGTRNNADLLVPKGATDGPRLNLAQCAALQGFPAGFEFFGKSEDQHRQMGNAVSVRLAEALGRALRDVIQIDGRTDER